MSFLPKKNYIWETVDLRLGTNLPGQHIKEGILQINKHLKTCSAEKINFMPIYKLSNISETFRKQKRKLFHKKYQLTLNSEC